MKENEIKITPLGGLGEIGLNCQLWETHQGIVMIDCGMMFPTDFHPGVDALIPHLETIKAIKNKISAIVLTHGHEDHIGALPWILPELNYIKIYSSRFTLELVRHRLEEYALLHKVELVPVEAGAILDLAGMKFHFYPVFHSIPQSFALGVETPAGKIIHSGDFKLDKAPLDGVITDLEALVDFAGNEGARLLLSDSTNITREGFSTSESEVRASLEKIFSKASGRIIITLFSSHIQRIQEVFELAAQFGREVVISGKSLVNYIGIASSLGILKLPENFHNAYNGMPDLPPEKTVLIVTGAQGEPVSALSRMVLGGHSQLEIHGGDSVIMSSRVIPGHTRAVSRLINEMYRLGAEVYYADSHLVHASGHAHAAELAELIHAVKPQLFIPVHGEYQHLKKHCRLAENNGVAKENILCLVDGQALTLTPENHRIETPFNAEPTLVDGKGVGDVGPALLKERRILSDEGMVAIFIAIDNRTGEILGLPAIVSLGVVHESIAPGIYDEIQKIIQEEFLLEREPQKLRENLRVAVRRFFRRQLERDPIVAVIVSPCKAE